MKRKTHKATLAALAATLTISFASAETGANAQAAPAPAIELPQPQLTGERVPVFVSEEVVQPLPESGAEAAAGQANAEYDSLAEMVDAIPEIGELSPEMECLAGAVYFESRGEPIEGQLAVARVVVNRAAAPVFPSSYCGVVFQRAQFSFVKNGRMPSIKRSSDAWRRAKAIAKIAHEDLWESAARDSLYFHANYVSPTWSRHKTARTTIDTHIFYR